jgi:hypothetical protein
MQLPALAIRQANDAVPGTLPRISGGNHVVMSNAEGTAAEWVALADVGLAGPPGDSLIAAPALVATTNVAALSGTQVIDGIATNTVTGDVLLTAQTTTSENGYWTAQIGAWVRPSYYNTDAAIAKRLGVISGGVLGGQLAGTLWAQDSGPTLAGAKSFTQYDANNLVIDLSTAPYNLHKLVAPTTNTSGYTECVSKINTAIYRASLVGSGTVVMPRGWCQSVDANQVALPIILRPGVKLVGPGTYKGGVANSLGSGGWSTINATTVRQIATGPQVDTGATAGLKMRDATYTDPILNVSHTGMRIKNWTKYTARMYFRPVSISTGGLWATRGDATSTDSLTSVACDQCYLLNDGSLLARLRVRSQTNFLALAAGAVPTLSGTAIGDAIFIKIKISTAGARGAFYFQISINDGASYSKPILSAATVDLGAYHLQLTGVTLNWTNASCALTDSWQNWETKTATTPVSTYTINQNWCFVCQWDPAGANKLQIFGGIANGSNTYTLLGESTAYTITNATVHQKLLEECIIGSGQSVMSSLGYNAADGWFGSFSMYAEAPTIAGVVVPYSLPTGTQSKMGCYFIPNTPYLDDANVLYGWLSYFGNGALYGGRSILLLDRMAGNVAFTVGVEMTDVDLICTANRNGIFDRGPVTNSRFRRIRVTAGQRGYLHAGTGYGNDCGDLDLNCSICHVHYDGGGCEISLYGANSAIGAGVGLRATQASFGPAVYINCFQGGDAYAALLLSNVSGTINMSTDEEGGRGYSYAPFSLESTTNGVLTLTGVANVSNTGVTPILVGSKAGAVAGIVHIDCAIGILSTLIKEQISIRDTAGPTVVLGARYLFVALGGAKPALTDQIGYVLPYGGKLPPALTTGDINANITHDGKALVYTAILGVVTAARAFTLLDTNSQEGSEIHLKAQTPPAFALTIKDSAATTIDTISTSFRGTIVYRHNGVKYVLVG